ncbi:MAG: phage major tail tube protein [Proteobacteria bacterium]|nr:phage major tail tube protein [Pseudomonadota bacterium]
MRHILRGYTMWANGYDFGLEVEELQCALPDETYVDHSYGGAVMAAQVPMIKIGNLEPTMKFASHNPRLAELLLLPPGATTTFTFRSHLVDEMDGASRSNVIIYEGRLAAPAPDGWSGDKAGLGYTIKGVRYYRYEIGNEPIHEIGLFPPKLVINRVDRLAAQNDSLGR